MAKKQDKEVNHESVGALSKTKTTQKERNLKLKAELIAQGLIPEPDVWQMGTLKERNLFLKAQLEKDGKAKS